MKTIRVALIGALVILALAASGCCCYDYPCGYYPSGYYYGPYYGGYAYGPCYPGCYHYGYCR